jgi:hypothetical protein
MDMFLGAVFLMEPSLKIDLQQRCLATMPPAKITDGFLSQQPLLEIGAICKNNFYTSGSHTCARGRSEYRFALHNIATFLGFFIARETCIHGLEARAPATTRTLAIQLCAGPRDVHGERTVAVTTHPNDTATA